MVESQGPSRPRPMKLGLGLGPWALGLYPAARAPTRQSPRAVFRLAERPEQQAAANAVVPVDSSAAAAAADDHPRPRNAHQDEGSGPSARFRARCSRRSARFPAARPRGGAPVRVAGTQWRPCRRAARGPTTGAATPATSRSMVILPDPFGPRIPTSSFTATSIDTP